MDVSVRGCAVRFRRVSSGPGRGTVSSERERVFVVRASFTRHKTRLSSRTALVGHSAKRQFGSALPRRFRNAVAYRPLSSGPTGVSGISRDRRRTVPVPVGGNLAALPCGQCGQEAVQCGHSHLRLAFRQAFLPTTSLAFL